MSNEQGFYNAVDGTKNSIANMLNMMQGFDMYNNDIYHNERMIYNIQFELKLLKRQVDYLQNIVDKELQNRDK